MINIWLLLCESKLKSYILKAVNIKNYIHLDTDTWLKLKYQYIISIMLHFFIPTTHFFIPTTHVHKNIITMNVIYKYT